jgi:hypothetical protein
LKNIFIFIFFVSTLSAGELSVGSDFKKYFETNIDGKVWDFQFLTIKKNKRKQFKDYTKYLDYDTTINCIDNFKKIYWARANYNFYINKYIQLGPSFNILKIKCIETDRDKSKYLFIPNIQAKINYDLDGFILNARAAITPLFIKEKSIVGMVGVEHSLYKNINIYVGYQYRKLEFDFENGNFLYNGIYFGTSIKF